ncbi:hypothetical protein [Algibacter luteus]|nr:hypothetical protein [Algibacter luteus]WJJ95734.1 hypothetical protein O5O44_10910 [Algibacter luteus]
MTNEDYIIEILLKAEKLGVRKDVLKEVSKVLEEREPDANTISSI